MIKFDLNFNLNFADLYSVEGLSKIDFLFTDFLIKNNIILYNQLVTFRKFIPSKVVYSKFIVELGPLLEDFIVELFNIEDGYRKIFISHKELDNIYLCKRLFVQRQAAKKYRLEEIQKFDINKIRNDLSVLIGELEELNFANNVIEWINSGNKANLDVAEKFAAWASISEEGKKEYSDSNIFQLPRRIDHESLIELETEIIHGIKIIKNNNNIARNGFSLTDQGADLRRALSYSNYCIYCHNQNKDSCSIGLLDNNGITKKNSHNIELKGCPLEEKISEMNQLKSEGHFVAALAAAVIDNPMLAATGHRICNDCMKSCIYQKQEPVNIPQIETRVLKDVLSLPWGFEIYSLLTKWNPLNVSFPIAKPSSGYKVLIAGLGPAGFTLSHYLLNEGHIVVGIDGLKIEPLNEKISGVNIDGTKTDFQPIYDVETLYEKLENRIQAGFGGVTEYGITVRWNKNFLKIIRIILERRESFSMIGGVRFNSQINTKSAFDLGFNHITLALGAGAPNILNIKNSMSRGIRAASDFLMSVNMNNITKQNSISNLQLRLPVVVIGGGLTATDAATEALAYYPIQVENFLHRYQNNIEIYGFTKTRENWTEEEAIIAEEFISHALLFREENKKTNPNIIKVIKNIGGSKIIYRKSFTESPAYKNNHEEVKHALDEGVEFIENFNPKNIELDKYGHVKSIVSDDNIYIEAKTILYAIGTNPNTILSKEDHLNYSLIDNYFKIIDESGNIIDLNNLNGSNHVNIITSKYEDKYVTFIGDLHPSYQGNVVKAMKSAKDSYAYITKLMSQSKINLESDFLNKINNLLRSRIHKIVRLNDKIIEILVEAPLAAEMFQPGQFYKLQNFEYYSKEVNNTKLSMENIALTGAISYKKNNLLSLIVLEMGGSTDLCKLMKPGEYISLMGPTGTATEIVKNKTILLAGGGLGNAVLFSIGKALKEAGSKVIYFAAYKSVSDRYKIEEIEKAADVIIWCCEEDYIDVNREQDRSYKGRITDAIEAYSNNDIDPSLISIVDVDMIIAIGSDKMMQAINFAREYIINSHLKKNHKAIASVNSPMQCMMKEICAQCIQKHVDKSTGVTSFIYSCHNQDQDMNKIDFEHLDQRLKQNSLFEKNTHLWIKYCLSTMSC